MSISAPCGTENNRTGNGSYTPLKRKKKEDEKKGVKDKLDQLDKKDPRMRFRNSKDPVFVAFDYLDKQPLKKLAIEFVKDTINDMIIFVTKFN